MSARVVLFCVCLVTMPILTQEPRGSYSRAQEPREVRELVRLQKSVSRMAWLDERTLLTTLPGVSIFGGNREIGLIDIPSGAVKVLERGGCASPSPDRTRVAWIPGPSYRNDVWLLDLRTQEKRKLTSDQSASCVTWSPDGRRIAFTPVDDIQIATVDNGRIEHVISTSVRIDDFAWSPDGQTLALAAGGLVYTYDLRDRRRQVFFQLMPQGSSASDLAFSPDGRFLFFVQRFAYRRHIVVHDGTSLRVLTPGHSPIWHPDGRSVLLARGYDCQMGDFCAGDALYFMRFP